MAIIYSYPTVTPTTDDLLLGTDVNGTGQPTKNFSIASIIDLINSGSSGLGAVIKLDQSAKDPVTPFANQSAIDFLNISGTGTLTFPSLISTTITNAGAITTASLTATGAISGLTLSGILTAGSSIAGLAGGTDGQNVLGVTQNVGDNSTRLATTAYVMAKVDPSVLTFLGTTGGNQTVNLTTQALSLLGTTNQIESVSTAQTITFNFPAAGVILPDGSAATTQATTDNSTLVATTAFVQQEITAQDLDFSGTTGTGAVDLDSQVLAVTGTGLQITTAAAAQGLSIALTPSITITGTYTGATFAGDLNGTVNTVTTGVTQAAGDDSTLIATTEYVDNAAGAKTLDYAGDATGPFALNLATDDLEFNGDSNITVTAAAVAVTKGIVTVDLNNDVTITGTMKADTFTTTAGTAAWATTILTGFTSMTSDTFVADGTATVTDFQGNASSATRLGTANGTITLSAGSGATLGVGSDSVVYTSGGTITLTTTLAASTVTSKLLTGISFSTGTAVVATDSILIGVGKLQKQITDLPAGLDYVGTWDASGGAGGTPDLTAVGTHIPGQYYIVATAGNARPNGAATEPSEWKIGDWVIRADATLSEWSKIDNTSEVTTDGSGVAGIVPIWNNASELGASQIQDLTVVGRTVTTIVDGGTGGDLTVQGHTVLGSAVGDTTTVTGAATFETAPIIEVGLGVGVGAAGGFGSSGQVLTSGGANVTAMTWSTPTVGVVTSITGGTGITISGTAAVPIVAITYTGASNAILAAAAGTPVATDELLFNNADVGSGTIQRATIATITNLHAETLAEVLVTGNVTGATDVVVQENITFSDSNGTGQGNIIMGTGSDMSMGYNGNYGLELVSAAGALSGGIRMDSPLIQLRDLTSPNKKLYFQGVSGAAVNLYYDGTKKFETTATGIEVPGTITIDDITANAGDLTINVGSSVATYTSEGESTGPTYGTHVFKQKDGPSGTLRTVMTLNTAGNVDLNGSINSSTAINSSGIITATSSSAGDYVRMYGAAGTGKWDIYGNGANLRITDNESAGLLAIDAAVTIIDSSDPSNLLKITVDDPTIGGSTTAGFLNIDGGTAKLYIGQSGGGHFGLFAGDGAYIYNNNTVSASKLAIGNITNTDLILGTNNAANLTVQAGGMVQLNTYGSGTQGGTTTSLTPGYTQSPSTTLVIAAINNNIDVGMSVSGPQIQAGTKVTGGVGTVNITLDTTTGPVIDVPSNATMTFSAIAVYDLSVDSSGNIIETASSGGGGGAGTFNGSGSFVAGAAASAAFTLTRGNSGALIFDVYLTSGTAAAGCPTKKYTVAHTYNTTPVYNKIIDTGPASGDDFTVTFVTSGNTSVICNIAATGTTQNISYTVQVGYDSVNTVTIA
jgi:hypothetical protein